MDVRAVIALLRARSVLASRDRWTRDALLAHQSRALRELRAFAFARSPFYREFHRGLEGAPLEALPVLTKATLMERFDELVTDRDVRLGDVQAHLASAGPTDLFRGRYRVAATGGTTGRRGVFLADRSEWTSVLAAVALRRIDALVFTGGIGEHAGRVRAAIVERLAVLGFRPIMPDEDGEDRVLAVDAPVASADDHKPAALRIEAREDLVIARAVTTLVAPA